MAEADLYPAVVKWLKKEQRCFEARANTGVQLGRIDAIGLRDTGRELTGDTELVAVEVKAGNQPFGTAAGQAHGYSAYADRCYLADLRTQPFSDDEKEIASHLHIGLIAIRQLARGFKVTEVLGAPRTLPIESRRLEVAEKLGYSRCTVCHSMFRRGTLVEWSANIRRQGIRGGALARAAEEEKGLVYWLTERDTRSGVARRLNYYRRYVCADCVSGLFSETA